MISEKAQLSIQRLPISCIQVKECQARYLDQLEKYVALLRAHPDMYAGLLYVVPSDTHEGMYALLDGHHRFCASVIAGRTDALCVVERDG